jgi:3-methyladenine DNA glycosylase AlkC
MVDDFATGKAGITPALLRRCPAESVALMHRWSQSPNRWKRRTSVVTFTRRVATEGEFIDEAMAICERLRFDEEDLVRKGVGWALKDGMRAGPGAKRRVIGMVKAMRREGVSAVVTLSAVRDLKGAERESVLKVRAR